ncbi:MAG: hypothetical protein ACRD50_11870 [Candidatus Acidiferrales bacterium]
MAQNHASKLTSWKEIAAHLGRDVRTAQRWERELGLPVHRVPGTRGHSIFAYTEEIDAWLEGRDASHPGTASANSTRPSMHIHLAAVVLLLLLACGVGLWAWRARSEEKPASVTFTGSGMAAWSAGRNLLWSYDFVHPLWAVTPQDAQNRVQIADLYNDGEKEVLVAAPLCMTNQGDLSTDALYCFSSRGKLLWTHKFDEKLRMGGTEFGSRWLFGTIMADSDRTNQSVWCTAVGFPWWPSLLIQFSAEGKEIAEFVNSGHLHALNSLHNSSGSFILAGGINNEYNSAMLAVLRADQPSGTSPQSPGPFRCDDCPKGQPYRYFLFPRSEVNKVAGPPYNQTRVIQVDIMGVHVVVNEAVPDNGIGADWEIYDFSTDLVPQSVSVSDFYWEDHRRLSAEGKIKHSVEECPERTQPRTVREWSPAEGWKEIKFPPVSSSHRR